MGEGLERRGQAGQKCEDWGGRCRWGKEERSEWCMREERKERGVGVGWREGERNKGREGEKERRKEYEEDKRGVEEGESE